MPPIGEKRSVKPSVNGFAQAPHTTQSSILTRPRGTRRTRNRFVQRSISATIRNRLRFGLCSASLYSFIEWRWDLGFTVSIQIDYGPYRSERSSSSSVHGAPNSIADHRGLRTRPVQLSKAWARKGTLRRQKEPILPTRSAATVQGAKNATEDNDFYLPFDPCRPT
jgi:hypothetical protein